MTPPIYKNRPEPTWVIGVDESGTGAFAGPFTVCAFMSHVQHAPWLKEVGAKDSKTLSATKRFKLREELAAVTEIADIVVVPGDYHEQRKVWREAIAKAVSHCLKAIHYDTLHTTVMIDGAHDAVLANYFSRTWDMVPTFVVKGDQKIPQISAASIFAKCERSELMAKLHHQFPMYGWAANDGYGTAEHLAAIQAHGICELHRRVQPLLPYFQGEHGEGKSQVAVVRKVHIGG